MSERTEFWWITSAVWGLPDLTPARVTYRDGMPSVVLALGQDERFRPEDVRLIERVLPAGRATPAALHRALAASFRHGTGYVSRLQGCEVTDEDGEPTGQTNTLIDGYFDLAKAAEILAAGGDAA
ncbi:hypothetical protein [Methylobacterium brachiatum]|jgi:hypothetical protein|uniref:hypothetical protein n=1 Tax=Methylobacterium brachiatum TaxID=269660 RepID=UPI002448C46F|nr:hypothetical protein [Methylobacterium brachiatum]MDH2309248.1 hypothetical protein [Methylobacterium brachiatum]